MQAPVLGPLRQQLVQFPAIAPYAREKSPREFDQRRIVAESATEECVTGGQIAGRVQIVLVEDLQDDFAGSTAA